MKRFASFAVLSVLILAGCHMAMSTPSKSSSAPSSAQISGNHGLFVAEPSATAGGLRRSLTARMMTLVSATGATAATLGEINASGTPQSVTFVDSSNNVVTATVNQAEELTASYVLLNITYGSPSTTETVTVNISTGSLATVSPSPDNWSLIWSTSSTMYYEAGGDIDAANLSSGSVTVLSSGSTTWNENNLTSDGSSSWGTSTWVYADSAGVCYAINIPNSSAVMALAIEPNNISVDFGSNPTAYTWYTNLSFLGPDVVAEPLVDSATGLLYLLTGETVYGGQPIGGSGSTVTGYALEAFPATLNPAQAGVMSVASSPIAYSYFQNYQTVRTTYVGFGDAMQSSVLTDGPDTYSVAVNSGTLTITYYDTASVPVNDTGVEGVVANWQYSGGNWYAGPAASNTISEIMLPSGGGTASAPILATASNAINSWSIVGGVLFYEDATGTTYQETVNTAAGTASAPTVYSGGTVAAITQ